MADKILDIGNISTMISLFGSYDSNIKILEEEFGVNIINRDTVLKIEGDEKNVQLAEKTGFSYEDAQVIKECLRTLFVNDASSARPDGSMEVVGLYWFEHNCPAGQYSAAKIHRSVKVTLKDPNRLPASVDDYEISVDELPGLTPEIIEGV